MRRFSVFFYAAALLAFTSSPLFSRAVFAQSNPLPRITEAVDNAKLAPLRNQIHPLLAKSADQGPVDGALKLDRITLLLNRSSAQQQALDELTAEQQDKSSPNYHRWLTPQEFGARFGTAESDIEKVTAWLKSEGFTVDRVANGRGFIEFSGTAAQVSSAFHTSMHNYSLNGEAHIANSTTLAIPAALAPVVTGVRSLHDFRKQPMHYGVQAAVAPAKAADGSRPAITVPQTNAPDLHVIGPEDFATIYDSQPLITNNIKGAGVTIAVVGRSNINLATITNFRTIFGLGAGSGSVVLNGADPGVLDQIGKPCTPTLADCSERDEALLDNEWSAAVAPNAVVKFVVSQSTNAADGVDLSEQFIIDNNVGDVMTESFGGCEAQATQADSNAVSALAQQGAMEGISYMVSTGDNGAAGCANPNTATANPSTSSVNILASSPFTVGVGGTQFNENCTIGADGVTLTCADDSKYWGPNADAGFKSVLGPIPERVWNEACPASTTGSVTGCTAARANLFAGSGGASVFVTKPSFQQLAIIGIPAANHRYLPDVSLTASGHDAYFVCLSDADCQPTTSGGSFSFHLIAGTSASAPAFAGVMALVDQSTGSRQGSPNSTLYSLAASETFANCDNSNLTQAALPTCIFRDTTLGNNAVPGEAGYGTTTADFQATVGYDQATGLGSVDVNNLVTNWASGGGVVKTGFNVGATSTVLSVSAVGSSAATTVVITPSGGFTGTVTLTCTVSGATTTLPTCAVSPGSVTLNASVVTASLTIGTAAPSAALKQHARAEWLAAGGIAFAGVFFFGLPRRRNWGAMLGLLLLAVVLNSVGCGGGSGTIHNPGTAAGTFTAKVTGTSGSATSSVTVTVVVP